MTLRGVEVLSLVDVGSLVEVSFFTRVDSGGALVDFAFVLELASLLVRRDAVVPSFAIGSVFNSLVNETGVARMEDIITNNKMRTAPPPMKKKRFLLGCETRCG